MLHVVIVFSMVITISLIPRPLSDFISQPWRKKNLGVAWERGYIPIGILFKTSHIFRVGSGDVEHNFILFLWHVQPTTVTVLMRVGRKAGFIGIETHRAGTHVVGVGYALETREEDMSYSENNGWFPEQTQTSVFSFPFQGQEPFVKWVHRKFIPTPQLAYIQCHKLHYSTCLGME